MAETDRPGTLAMRDAGTPPVIVAAFPKNTREEVRVTLGSFKGRRTIDARVWALREGSEAIATRSGITMSVRHLKALADGLATALAEAERLGVLTDE